MAYRKFNSDGPSAEEKALDRFADLMIEKIKSLQKDWEKPWFSENMLKWPKNLSGRKYNGMNAIGLMLLSEQKKYELPVFCTFQRVVGLNYDADKKPLVDKEGNNLPTVTVNKGEKSFPVFITTFTCVNKDSRAKIPYDDYKKLSNEEKQDYNVYPKLNVYNVFNVDQTNIKEARPELYAKLQEQNQLQKAKVENGEVFSFPAVDEMIAKNAWVCPIRPIKQDEAYYSPSRDVIVVPEKNQFIDGESYYGTTFHEMIHSTGHTDRLNRLEPGSGFGSDSYAREELVAELGAALTCSSYGIVKNMKGDSAAYLKSWLDHLQKEPDFIKSTLQDVKKATAMVTGRIDRVQEQIDTYQSVVGNEREFPDMYDMDMDGNTVEVAHSELQPFEQVEEENMPFKGRGR